MIKRPMHCAEIAERLGVALDTFYKRRHQYTQCDGMPAPISRIGRPAYERIGMEAWLTRHDPRRPPAPANDPLPMPDPVTDEEHRARLAIAYAPKIAHPALDTRRRGVRG